MKDSRTASAGKTAILWLLIVVLASGTLSVMLQLPFRQRIFVVVLATGVMLLLQLYRSILPPRVKKTDQPLLTQPIQLPPAASIPVTPTPPVTQAPKPVEAETLSGEAAREWLDNFLVRQQEK